MADTTQTVARKRNYYHQIMQKAQQLGDQTLVRIILKKKLAYLSVASAVSSAEFSNFQR